MALLSGDRGIDGASGSRATYNLDRAGNRTSIVDGGVTRTYTRDVTNEYTAAEGSAVTNNSEHQISAYLGVSFGYVNDGQLSSVSAGSDNCTFGYDALGRRVKRLLNGDVRYYIYDGEKALLDLDGNGDVNGWNVYGKGVDELLERGTTGLDGSWHWCFVQSDHEGSVTHLTDAAGAVLEKYKYDAFGKPVIMNAANAVLSGGTAYGNRFLFTGREYLANFGIYEYRARAYHPKLSRFTSEDPKLFVRGINLGKAPDDWSFEKNPGEAEFNLFRYCGNDPVDFVDPMGTDTLDVYIWNARLSEGGIGHVYIADRDVSTPSINGRNPALSSPFPSSRQFHAEHVQRDLASATKQEGRNADRHFVVQTDAKRDAEVRSALSDHAARPYWDLAATKSNETNCAVAGRAVLSAAGYRDMYGTGLTPGDLGNSLHRAASGGGLVRTLVMETPTDSHIPRFHILETKVIELGK